jgi:DNA-binding transcriptional ArsR family regulator
VSGSGAAKTRHTSPGPETASAVPVSDATIARLADVFKLLSDRTRLKILVALAQGADVPVGALAQKLGQPRVNVSQGLMLLRVAGLIQYRRQGANNFYRLASGHIHELLNQVFAECADEGGRIQFEGLSLTHVGGDER